MSDLSDSEEAFREEGNHGNQQATNTTEVPPDTEESSSQGDTPMTGQSAQEEDTTSTKNEGSKCRSNI